MDSTTAARLVELNNRFYEQFGEAFSASRERLQPGVKRVLAALEEDGGVLDLGCGNGEVARELGRRGHRGRYLGLDFSLPLLQQAQSRTAGLSAAFLRVDLTQLAALHGQPPLAGDWGLVLCLAALHHIPGEALRLEFLRAARGWLAPQGRFVLSNWQFLNSPRLAARVQPWEAAGLAASQVDAGDHLLDWKRGGTGLRYVHHFSEAELARLAAQAGFEVTDSFYSDGEGGRLGLYQTWIPA